MTRQMIDCDHTGLPFALGAIRALPSGSLVAMYVTGSLDIISTTGDWDQIPSDLTRVTIDQGFTGSPVLTATERDCENGGWNILSAVNRTGWNVPRPTLYLGFPDTVQEAANAGWRGDVMLVNSSSEPPTTIPGGIPEGINVVGIQWGFADSHFDRSVIFDPTWPEAKMQPFPFDQVGWRHCGKCQSLFYAGKNDVAGVCPAPVSPEPIGTKHDGTGSGNYQVTDTAAH